MIAPQAGVTGDSLRAVLDTVFADPKYAWQRTPSLFGWVRELWSRLLGALDYLHAAHPVAYWALIGGLTILLVAILTHLGYLIFQALRPQARPAGRAPTDFVPARDAAWYRQRAQELEDAGRLLDSLVHRFIGLVLQLELHGVLKVHPAKTPAEYLGEAALDPDGRATLGRVVRDYYDHVFGGVPVDRATLDRFDRHAALLTAHGQAA